MPVVLPRYYYCAHAVGASGTLVTLQNGSPFTEQFSAKGASVVPNWGGTDEALEKEARFAPPSQGGKVLIEVADVVSRVSGVAGPVKDTKTTEASVRLGLMKVMDRIEARDIAVRGVSQYSPAGQVLQVPEAVIGSLTLDGCPVKITYNTATFAKAAQIPALVAKYNSSEANRKKLAKLFPANINRKGNLVVAAGSGLPTSLVAGLAWADKAKTVPEVTFEENVIHWPGVGEIYLGELAIGADWLEATMVRFELGTPQATLLAAKPKKAKAGGALGDGEDPDPGLNGGGGGVGTNGSMFP